MISRKAIKSEAKGNNAHLVSTERRGRYKLPNYLHHADATLSPEFKYWVYRVKAKRDGALLRLFK